MMSFQKLKSWAFDTVGRNGAGGRIFDFPECCQRKYVQLNSTWGRCVPIATLKKEIEIREYELVLNELVEIETAKVEKVVPQHRNRVEKFFPGW